MSRSVEDYPRTLLELERRFPTDPACREYLFSLRWPGGFICPRCGCRKAWETNRGLWHCGQCCHQASVTAGTVFQDTHLPLTVWFRAIWQVTSQKTGASALGVQRVLGLGSYKTAWTILHKLRRAMVRPGRDRLGGTVEVDESYVGAPEEGVIGRLTVEKSLVIVAAQQDGRRIGRIRMARIPDLSKDTLHAFIAQAIEPGSIVRTDGLPAYRGLEGYRHEPVVIRRKHANGQRVAAPGTSGGFPAQTVVAGHAAWPLRSGLPGLLPGRIHLPIQPAHLRLPREAVLPPDPAGGAGAACTVSTDHCTPIGWGYLSQVNKQFLEWH